MNIYRVCSETLYNYECISYYGPSEPYCIVALVAAKSRSQAKYLAWQTDTKTFESNITEMPRMSVRICKKDIVMSSGIVSKDSRFQDCWGCADWADL